MSQKYEQKREELEQLVVRAPHAGKVIGRNLDALAGRYLAKGSLILAIGDESAKEIRVSIAQENALQFRSRIGTGVRVYFPDAKAFVAPLATVEPRASTIPLHLSLCTSHGGQLTVRTAEAQLGYQPETDYELLAPRFIGVVSLTTEQSGLARAGQRALIALRAQDTIGRHVHQLLVNWVDAKLGRQR
jgi:hypothetical protein